MHEYFAGAQCPGFLYAVRPTNLSWSGTLIAQCPGFLYAVRPGSWRQAPSAASQRWQREKRPPGGFGCRRQTFAPSGFRSGIVCLREPCGGGHETPVPARERDAKACGGD